MKFNKMKILNLKNCKITRLSAHIILSFNLALVNRCSEKDSAKLEILS